MLAILRFESNNRFYNRIFTRDMQIFLYQLETESQQIQSDWTQ